MSSEKARGLCSRLIYDCLSKAVLLIDNQFDWLSKWPRCYSQSFFPK